MVKWVLTFQSNKIKLIQIKIFKYFRMVKQIIRFIHCYHADKNIQNLSEPTSFHSFYESVQEF